MSITISTLARDYNAEPFEVEAALDIKVDSYDDEITEYTEAEAREILDTLAALAAE